jgi:hypothetical protein
MRHSSEKIGNEMGEDNFVEVAEKQPARDAVDLGDAAMTRRILLKLDFRYDFDFLLTSRTGKPIADTV